MATTTRNNSTREVTIDFITTADFWADWAYTHHFENHFGMVTVGPNVIWYANGWPEVAQQFAEHLAHEEEADVEVGLCFWPEGNGATTAIVIPASELRLDDDYTLADLLRKLGATWKTLVLRAAPDAEGYFAFAAAEAGFPS